MVSKHEASFIFTVVHIFFMLESILYGFIPLIRYSLFPQLSSFLIFFPFCTSVIFHSQVLCVLVLLCLWLGGSYRCRSKQIFGCAKDFLSFSQTQVKNFWATLCANVSSHSECEHLLLEWPPEKGLCTSWVPFLLVFLGSLPRFSKHFHRFCPDFNRV